MTKANQVRAALLAHPHSTNQQIADVTGFSTSLVATYTWQFWKRGTVTRKEIRKTLTNAPVYSYALHSNAVVHEDNVVQIKKPEKVKATVEKRAPVVSSIDSILSDFAASFAKSLAGAIIDQLKPRLEQELRHALPAALPAPTVSPPKPPVQEVIVARKRRIGVTGLLPQQAGTIQSEFCDTFDITFWNDRSGSSYGQLKAMGIGCEAVFCHVEHASHKSESTLKSVGAKIVRVNGGVSAMRDALTRYYVEEAV